LRVDVAPVSLDFTEFVVVHLNRLLNLKGQNAYMETYRGIAKELKNDVGLSG